MALIVEQVAYLSPAWQDCKTIRTAVFVVEQHVPDALEWDAEDAQAIHLLARKDGRAVACARVLTNGHIGRMAVLPEWRKQGIGVALLNQAISACRGLHIAQARLSAQTHAIGFYMVAGFKVVSAPYLEANIPHVDMVLELL